MDQHDRDPEKQQSRTNTDQPVAQPVSGRQDKVKTTEPKAGSTQRSSKYQNPRWLRRAFGGHRPLEWMTFVFEVLTFFALCLYTFYAGKQWDTMDKQLATMRAGFTQTRVLVRQAISQTATANGVLKSTLESNRTNREALVSVQRAFVTAQAIQAMPIQNASAKTVTTWQFYVPWENSGATPTRFARSYFGYKLTMPDDATFVQSTIPVGTPLPLGPKASLISIQIPIPISFITAIQGEFFKPPGQRTIHLYFWGWISYNDVFKNTKLHITEFCRELTQVNGDPSNASAATHWLYSLCSQHNCVDEECKDYRKMATKLRR